MSKQVRLGIRPGIRLPHNIEGIQVETADQLVSLETKHRLMALRPNLFRQNDPDWPKKVVSVEVVAEAEIEATAEAEPAEATEEKPVAKKGGKKSGSDPA
jgi:hypothetical protein